MNALVTGATGFVGRHLVDALVQAGDSVTALVRSPEKGKALGKGVRLAPGHLGSMEALRSAVHGQDVIYHVAGLVAARNEAEFLAVNRDGTLRLVEAAADAGCPRIVLVSSLAAGGPVARGTRRSGDEEAAPVTAYGRSKLAGERAVRQAGLPWVIVRPPAVYGPFDTEMLRVFRAVRLGLVPVFGDGSQQLSLVYGPDLGRALAAAGRIGAAEGKIFYPCHPEVVTTRELVITMADAMTRRTQLVRLPRWVARSALGVTGTLARLTSRSTVLTPDKAKEFFAPAWTCDPTPLTALTGWQAEFDLARGAAATVGWYRQRGML